MNRRLENKEFEGVALEGNSLEDGIIREFTLSNRMGVLRTSGGDLVEYEYIVR